MSLATLIEELKSYEEGTTIDVSYVVEKLEALKPTKNPVGRRGVLAGVSVQDMTDEQLKREKINSGSVLYKAKQRQAKEEVIAANQARFDAVVAELAARKPAADEEVGEDGLLVENASEEV